MSLPSTMKALKVQDAKKASVEDVPLPKLRDEYILVKVSAVALNPTDWKHIDYMAKAGATVGCDYAGTIVEVGKSVKKALKEGDRIAGMTHGVNAIQPEDGAFGEYLVAKDGIQIKIPDNLSDEEAATLGVGISTIGQGLYQSLGLPLPGSQGEGKEKEAVLIYGGSTSTGLFALQWAKLSGLTVITTCRPHNFDLVKQYGADAAFDYSDPSKCAEEIRDYTSNNLKYAFDCISEHSSTQICADSLSPSGGHYSSLLAVKFPEKENQKVEAGYTLAYTAIGEAFEFRGGTRFEKKVEDYEFGKKVWGIAEGLLAEGKFRVPPLKVGKGGLEGVVEGLDQLRQGKVSGEKLVYKL